MFEEEFTIILKQSIKYNQLERYFAATQGEVENAATHYDLYPDMERIIEDRDSPGGIKLSHAQRRMLMVLVALWEGDEADRVFGEGIGSIPTMIHAMDRQNRELLADLILTYPGWGRI
ncbi:hypothetical protein [Sneathiella chinensis]|uniref:Uncharacterized protein n=1 Tax=Sneathiella chinensis TaxID=349750 RepID=A0ABQ5U9T4_9PROT|nr:hypothetical protein [Sneathiella chinensis]GLQ08004.1 hypothetical protein GCM10007924_32260 [Sneathiella chinensis]